MSFVRWRIEFMNEWFKICNIMEGEEQETVERKFRFRIVNVATNL